MNKVAWWRLLVMGLALAFGLLYSLPNLFGESPAVQISTAKATLKVPPELATQIEGLLSAQSVPHTGVSWEANNTGNTVRARFASTDLQLKAKDLIEKSLNAGTKPEDARYVVAPNLVSASPDWLSAVRALPMYLGLDLRGGVHFLLEVDLSALENQKIELLANDLRNTLREQRVRYTGVDKTKSSMTVWFSNNLELEKAAAVLIDRSPGVVIKRRGGKAGGSAASPNKNATHGPFFGFDWHETESIGRVGLTATLSEVGLKAAQERALKQNLSTLSNRINELGVAEPIVQQQGASRIVVQLPGVQDTAKAKDILGRTATLEIRMVDDSDVAIAEFQRTGRPPAGLEQFSDRSGRPILLRKDIVLTGENLNDAQAGFDSQNPGEAAVHLTLDGKGARVFRDVTRDNIGKRLAILLIEKGRGEVVTAPVIRSEIPGGRVQISGSMTSLEAADTALLLRAGSLAAPMEIVEERLIGPSLGADNIAKGFNSTLYGFIVIAIFMAVYYSVFGVVSVLALSLNLLLLFAVLSLLQATLTLPGIAAIALTLGMAIDANVLINERVREELRDGATAQAAITAGYDKAWATILDSNITTLIAGIALLAFGSGPVRGFAVVHVLGILTSMFSAVFFSRGLINLWYGGKRRAKTLSVG
jgi:preprotein translocase subunit SecD